MIGQTARRWVSSLRGLVVAVGLAAGRVAYGQTDDPTAMMGLQSECALQLRDGQTIRAQVLEYVPGSHVVLRAFDGQTFRLPIEQVLEIRHPGTGPLPPSAACVRIHRDIQPIPARPGDPDARAAASEKEDTEAQRPGDRPARRAVRPPPPPVFVAPVGPPVTLSTDLPGVELDLATGVKKIETVHRGRPTVRWEYEWQKVCDAPCGLPVGAEGVYRVDGAGVRASAPFRLESPSLGPFDLKLRLGPAGMYRAGVGSVVLGVLSTLTGGGLLIAGGLGNPMLPASGTPPSYLTDYQSAQAAQRTLFTAGGVLLGTGIIEVVAGALLMRRGKSLVTVVRPNRPPDSE